MTGYGKCGQFEIIKADGSISKIENVKYGDSVLSLNNDYKIEISKVLKTVSNGVKPVYELTTKTGRTVKVALNHPFLTPDGWKELGLLKIDDSIAVPRIIPIEGSNDYDINKIILLGYLLGDGGLTQQFNIYFTNEDKNIISEINSILPKGYHLKHIPKSKFDYRICLLKRGSEKHKITEWIRQIGLAGCNSHAKYIPDFVFKLKNSYISLLINRMWACDGWVCLVSKKRIPQLGYCSVSIKMIQQLQHLLLRFGILSTMHKKKVKYKGQVRIAYEIIVNGKPNILKFIEKIGVFSKQEKLNEITSAYDLKGESCDSYDSIPKLFINARISIYFCKKNNLSFNTGKRRLNYGRTNLQKIAELYNDDEIKIKSNSDILWDKIKSIEYLYDDEVFDIQIENNHNFIGNDIFAHNTLLVRNLLTQLDDRRIIGFDSRKEHINLRRINALNSDGRGSCISDLVYIDKFGFKLQDFKEPFDWEQMGLSPSGARICANFASKVARHNNNFNDFMDMVREIPTKGKDSEMYATLSSVKSRLNNLRHNFVDNRSIDITDVDADRIRFTGAPFYIADWKYFIKKHRHICINFNSENNPAKAQLFAGKILNDIAPALRPDDPATIFMEESHFLYPAVFDSENVPFSSNMIYKYAKSKHKDAVKLILITQYPHQLNDAALDEVKWFFIGKLENIKGYSRLDEVFKLSSKLQYNPSRNYREWLCYSPAYNHKSVFSSFDSATYYQERK